MGLDGGTYITRSDVLRGQSWELNKAENSRSTRGGSVKGIHKRPKLDPKLERHTKWSTCSLSGQPLQDPLVADYLGNLYNKEAVLQFLLGRAGYFDDQEAEHRFLNQIRASGEAVDHLRSKRDIFDIQMDLQKDAEDASPAVSSYRCPITDLPCQSHPFAALSKCGHVFSQKAIHQMTELQCALCNRPFASATVIAINGTPEQMDELKERRLKAKIELKGKKGQKRKLLEAGI